MTPAVTFQVALHTFTTPSAQFCAHTFQKSLALAAGLGPRRLPDCCVAVGHIVQTDVGVAARVQLVAGVHSSQATVPAPNPVLVSLYLKQEMWSTGTPVYVFPKEENS